MNSNTHPELELLEERDQPAISAAGPELLAPAGTPPEPVDPSMPMPPAMVQESELSAVDQAAASGPAGAFDTTGDDLAASPVLGEDVRDFTPPLALSPDLTEVTPPFASAPLPPIDATGIQPTPFRELAMSSAANAQLPPESLNPTRLNSIPPAIQPFAQNGFLSGVLLDATTRLPSDLPVGSLTPFDGLSDPEAPPPTRAEAIAVATAAMESHASVHRPPLASVIPLASPTTETSDNPEPSDRAALPVEVLNAHASAPLAVAGSVAALGGLWGDRKRI